MTDPISEALYQPIRDKLSPLSPYILIAFIIFIAILGLMYWFWIRKGEKKNILRQKVFRDRRKRVRYEMHWIQDDYSIYDNNKKKYIIKELTEREGKRILKILKRKTFHKHYRQPLYRIGDRTYWKGIPIDDDEFEAVKRDSKELREYNYWVRRLNRRRRK